jgi:hypothetical protein
MVCLIAAASELTAHTYDVNPGIAVLWPHPTFTFHQHCFGAPQCDAQPASDNSTFCVSDLCEGAERHTVCISTLQSMQHLMWHVCSTLCMQSLLHYTAHRLYVTCAISVVIQGRHITNAGINMLYISWLHTS